MARQEVTAAVDPTLWRRDAIAGMTVARIAQKFDVSVATVRDHLGTAVSRGRDLVPGEEVHIDGMRGRWRFTGQVGPDGVLTFAAVTTNLVRFFAPERVTTIHRQR